MDSLPSELAFRHNGDFCNSVFFLGEKMIRGKRGQKGGGGGGGGGGGDPMQMISMILMIVSLVMAMSGQCNKEEPKNEKDVVIPGKDIIGPTIITKTCNELNGFECNPFTQVCRGDVLPASGNTKESICYSQSPAQPNNITEATLTCAVQRGFNCGLEKYCPNNQWISAKDTQMCCQSFCVERVQTTASFPTIGDVVIERFDTASFGVWYGSDPQTKTFDANTGFKAIGHPNFARVRSIGSNKYEFTVDEKKYIFTITKNEPAEIAAQVG